MWCLQLGDVTGDGIINILDLVQVVNYNFRNEFTIV